MRRKLAFLVAVFCATVLAMAVQKPVFMACASAGGWAGLGLDGGVVYADADM